MKSKQDIHLAIAVLTVMTFRTTNPEQIKLARKSASILCWVMGYPNDFDKFMEKIKENPPFDITPERLEELVVEAVKAVEAESEEGHSE